MFSDEELYSFILEASKQTYAGEGEKENNSQRTYHIEYEYKRSPFIYRDSYCGFIKSRGSEYVINEKSGEVIWENGYGGGMLEGKEQLAKQCFSFLKLAMQRKDKSIQSFRGPRFYEKDEWSYAYEQNGDIESFVGREEIFYNGELVFYHDICGGIVL